MVASTGGEGAPRISIVVATRNREQRLRRLIASLERQTVAPDQFEVIVVDDASSDGTATWLASGEAGAHLRLRTVRRQVQGGPGGARNTGWRLAGAPRVAFTDDDCEVSPHWLEALLAVGAEHPDAIIQGRVDPLAEELSKLSPFIRTLRIHGDGPYYQTCNISYPRALLERLDGFDAETFPVAGEDTDLAWRAIESGAQTLFEGRAQAFHAVNEIGARGRLKVAWRWRTSLQVYQRHPGARERVFMKRIFWKPWHYTLLRASVALVLPRRLRPLNVWLMGPYVDSIRLRCANEHGRPWHVPLYLAEDTVEIAAAIYASVTYRMLVL